MKVSVSLPEDDVNFLDEYARDQKSSRSAAVHRAVRLLRSTGLGAAYEEAWQEWAEGPDAAVWEAALDDGIKG